MARLATSLPAVIFAFAMFTSDSTALTGTESTTLFEMQDNPIATSEESIAAGRTIYGRFCRSCHGQLADGRGMAAPAGSRPANLIDAEWDYGSTDAEIFKIIKEGIEPKYDMDAWEGRISDDDMWNVINYLRDLASN
ncbi:MAG: c-type cytochrome [Acidobacteriota bacterium]|mgnify:CR=1 FL=1|nr:c-type cytochrome [Acidobacteriota bacterium]|tara:strand:- start:735 stop:1145 length:411 start_codon:yes stop_codon:yes gene_type:complete